jgi:hypothetical protein
MQGQTVCDGRRFRRDLGEIEAFPLPFGNGSDEGHHGV